jgi:metal-responsive CopG/Arc/MetJ family transcriptional regulator
MKKCYSTPILFKIDDEMLNKLDKATAELGHTRSLFIRDAICRRILDYEAHERALILSLQSPAFLASRDR